MNADVSILQKFRGLCDTGLFQPHPRGLSRRFDFILPPEPGDELRFTRKELVIRDERSFLDFISSVPTKVMEFLPNPRPSEDPLLKRPQIDFDHHMVLVSSLMTPTVLSISTSQKWNGHRMRRKCIADIPTLAT